MTARPRYRLELEALPSDVPAIVRLRLLLKTALRRDRLRCVSVESIESHNKTPICKAALSEEPTR